MKIVAAICYLLVILALGVAFRILTRDNPQQYYFLEEKTPFPEFVPDESLLPPVVEDSKAKG